MSVRIRLARGGSKKRPFHKIVVADKRSPRDGRFIEQIGYYNPLVPKDHPEHFKIDAEKAKAWIAKGAELTDRMARLMAAAGLVAAPKIKTNAEQPVKSAPKAKAQERLAAAKEAEEARKQAELEAKAAVEAAKAEAEAAAKAAAEAPAEEAAPAEAPATEEQPAE
ncbi:MAG: 30S ribosomal protein S16 [Alphaproteobacteria bacterium]|nr:30S ribosomal protein S16 [Alphaproteobacteria bacterium]